MERRNELIDNIYKSGIIDEISENIGVSSVDKDDFKQEIYLILLEYDFNKIEEMYDKGQLKWFIIRIMMNQYHSKNSPWFKKYKKYYQLIDGNDIMCDEVNCDEEYDNE